MKVEPTRVRVCNEKEHGTGPVVYWMQRDQRADNNWALLYAQEQALVRKVPLIVVFNVVSGYGNATFRQYDFMLLGLAETEKRLRECNIDFVLLQGEPAETIPKYVALCKAGELVVDFNPLQPVIGWKSAVAVEVAVRMTEVDAHNIVPCFVASDKQEYAAYTFRPKLHRLLPKYLTKFSKLQKHPYGSVAVGGLDWDRVRAEVLVNRKIAPVSWLLSGPLAARQAAKDFITFRLDEYAERRNNPTQNGQSNLSPYLHFGQLSAQWLAYRVNQAEDTSKISRDAFLEELIVRRELSDNFCFYNTHYNQVTGAHDWAQKTIAEHVHDKREYLYSKAQLEAGKTHDELWNAMQVQLRVEGKLHGWCRMYWAKKVLEWTKDAQTAVDIALYFNDTYSLDGNDPNGVVGVMWSICGVHDRAWNERPIFGKIRYMNYAGAKRKFDVAAYIAKYRGEVIV